MIIENVEGDFGRASLDNMNAWLVSYAPTINDPKLDQRLSDLFSKAQFERFLEGIDEELEDYGPVKRRFLPLYPEGTLVKLVEAWERYQESA
ncbi:hypothetical protein [Pseudomonas sp. NPDC008258]|uniref:hypothetical protein n=1 Tax=Pseudomonas sp. NPDC008258 TaxID=3364418 RepID=UPI0036F01EED